MALEQNAMIMKRKHSDSKTKHYDNENKSLSKELEKLCEKDDELKSLWQRNQLTIIMEKTNHFHDEKVITRMKKSLSY